eukprot:3192960-Amphidinium_carterae.1
MTVTRRAAAIAHEWEGTQAGLNSPPMEDVFSCGGFHLSLDYRLSGMTLNLPSRLQRRQRWKRLAGVQNMSN